MANEEVLELLQNSIREVKRLPDFDVSVDDRLLKRFINDAVNNLGNLLSNLVDAKRLAEILIKNKT